MAVSLKKEPKQQPKQDTGGTKVSIPEAFKGLFEPMRYKSYRGGRGSAKSTAFATALVILAAQKPMRILCAREFQRSLKDSVHRLIKDQIEKLALDSFYTVTEAEIRGANGGLFIFAGLANNVTQIKSLEGIDVAWVEEAQTISDESLDILLPTVRKEGSEIWFSWNPHLESDPMWQRFVINKPDNCIDVEVNFDQNPFFPETLRAEMEHCKKTDLDKYNWIWLGKIKTQSDAQVFKGKFVVCEFEPHNEKDSCWYHGLDHGFSQDRAALTRCFIRQDGRRRILCIDAEAGGIGIEIDKMKTEMFAKIPTSNRYEVIADNARPETNSFLRRQGLNIRAVKKFKGSVESAVEFVRSFDQIQIHPSCVNTAEEFRLYSYKVDKLTGNILPDLVDKHNHHLDSIFYAISKVIRSLGNAGKIELNGMY